MEKGLSGKGGGVLNMEIEIETKSSSDYMEKDSQGDVAIYIIVEDLENFREELNSELEKTLNLLKENMSESEREIAMVKSISDDIKIKLADVESYTYGESWDNLSEEAIEGWKKAKEIIEEAYKSTVPDDGFIFELYVDGVCVNSSA